MSLGKMKVLSVAVLIAVSGAVQAAVSQPMHVTIEYEYAKDGEIVSRKINGEMQRYEYDLRGQLTGVYDGNGKAVEAYTYDAAGNILKKTLTGTTTTFKYDAANQLVSKENAAGLVAYAYDAAGRMIREGDKEYRYSYLDKITSVIENGETAATMDYFVGGQIASVTRGTDAERFIWDGLALVHRDGSDYLNEPAIGGGNPVASDGKVMFNDRLGSTVAVKGDESYSMTSMSAFGESNDSGAFFTGKPFVGELGYAFLMRSYRPENGKWQTADPMGYPDGWNQLAYCNNGVTSRVDPLGASWIDDIISNIAASYISDMIMTGSGASAGPNNDLMISVGTLILGGITCTATYSESSLLGVPLGEGTVTVLGDQISVDRTEYEDYTNAEYYQYLVRKEPETYTIRNPQGDWRVELNGAHNLDLPSTGLEIILNKTYHSGLNSITVTSIKITGVLMVQDLNLWFINFVKE